MKTLSSTIPWAAALCWLVVNPAVAQETTIGELDVTAAMAGEGEDSMPGSRSAAITHYRALLELPGVPGRMRKEALRRLADLLMERAEVMREKQQYDTAESTYRDAVAVYEKRLADYPGDELNDRILYGLARARAQLGEAEETLKVLTRLAEGYPHSSYIDEVQFRRGEMLFAVERYEAAEQAYARVLRIGDGSPFHERALYKHGWSHYKQARYRAALGSFFALLDRTLQGAAADITSLGRAEQEVVKDILRAVALSFSHLRDTAMVARYFSDNGGRSYEAAVYQRIAELYTKQERYKDAADTYELFVQQHPGHAEAPRYYANVLEIYRRAGFTSLLSEARRRFVDLYLEHWARQQAGRQEPVRRLAKQIINELAGLHHAGAQRSGDGNDYEQAIRWYRAYLEHFPGGSRAVEMQYLLAEAFFETQRYDAAAEAYEKTAYDHPGHQRAAAAGYAAIVSYTRMLEQRRASGKETAAVAQRVIASALRFADAFAADDRTPAVLARTAQRLFDRGEWQRAVDVAQRVVEDHPHSDESLRRTAWMVTAHAAFDQGRYEQAASHYRRVLKMLPGAAAGRAEIMARLAAAIYKHGEQLYAAGDIDSAVEVFLRLDELSPDAPYRAQASFDAATGYLQLQRWPQAITQLRAFIRDYPGHPLYQQVVKKLAVAYENHGELDKAAAQYQTIAGFAQRVEVKREAALRAARMYEQAGALASAVDAYEQYMGLFDGPVEDTIEIQYHIAGLYEQRSRTGAQQRWLEKVIAADGRAGDRSTPRTRYLAARSALALAEARHREFDAVRLVAPLRRQLKLKKAKMEAALDGYSRAARYGIAAIATAATYHMGQMYSDLSRELLDSERPDGLSDEELLQYDVLLEEQAFPFEEKAIAIHEANAQRTAEGLYNQWVKKSLAALRRFLPVRYAKAEKSEGLINGIN